MRFGCVLIRDFEYSGPMRFAGEHVFAVLGFGYEKIKTCNLISCRSNRGLNGS